MRKMPSPKAVLSSISFTVASVPISKHITAAMPMNAAIDFLPFKTKKLIIVKIKAKTPNTMMYSPLAKRDVPTMLSKLDTSPSSDPLTSIVGILMPKTAVLDRNQTKEGLTISMMEAIKINTEATRNVDLRTGTAREDWFRGDIGAYPVG